MPTPSDLVVSLARGPLVGVLVGLILYGITCMQAFFYFRTYEQDGWGLKLVVTFLVFLESAHAAMTMRFVDYYLVEHYGNLQVLESAAWVSMLTFILGFVIDFYVYLYFTWRIWLFNERRMWTVVFMTAISISRTVISIMCTVFSILKPTWGSYLAAKQTFIIIGNILFIVGDAFSACILSYHLAKYKSWRRPPRGIDHILNRLLIFVVATGALTSLVDLIALILTLTQPLSLAFLSTILIQTRLYANSLLASLNIRQATTRTYDDPSTPIEHPTISLRFARPSDLSSSLSKTDERIRGRMHGPNKSGVESWQMTHVLSRTCPQV